MRFSKATARSVDTRGSTHPTMKYQPKTKPFKHQARATIAAVKARNYGIFMEPRLGKTKAALDYVAILALKGEVKKVLIVAPRIAIPVWEREIEAHFPYPAKVETFDEEWYYEGMQSLPRTETSNRVPPTWEGWPSRVLQRLSAREEQEDRTDASKAIVLQTSSARGNYRRIRGDQKETARTVPNLPQETFSGNRPRSQNNEVSGPNMRSLQRRHSQTRGGSQDTPQGDFVSMWLAGREETFVARKVVKGSTVPYRPEKHEDKEWVYHRPKQQELEEWGPDAIIFDESHEYKRPGGRGAQDAWRLVRRLRVKCTGGRPFVLLLSGTPNPKGWRDLFAQFRIMDETLLGTSAGAFDRRHVVYGHGKRRFNVVAYRGENRIKKIVRENSISVSAEEAGLAGTRFWDPLHVTLPEKAMKVYMQLVSEFLALLESGEVIDATNAGVLRLRLLQVTGGFTTDGVQIHRAKLEAATDWLRLLHEQEEPFIVGCRFTPEVLAVAEAVSKFSRIEIVHGATRKSRDMAIKDFQRGQLDGLIFQIQAGSAAIELARAAELVYFSLPDGWVHFKQFGDRVMGPNQKRPVRYTPILAKGTVDQRVLEGLRRKEEWHNELMGCKSIKGFLLGE